MERQILLAGTATGGRSYRGVNIPCVACAGEGYLTAVKAVNVDGVEVDVERWSTEVRCDECKGQGSFELTRRDFS